MHFVIAANFRLKVYARRCVSSIERFGYSYTAFDLGGLGFGHPFQVGDESFQTNGFYRTKCRRYRPRAMHKPGVIAIALRDATETLVYLDVDTTLRGRIDEITGPFDVGVTVRRPEERERDGPVNAGVMFFNPTAAAKQFVERWQEETIATGDDQEGLINLLSTPGCRIAEFPTDVYNWYYLPGNPPPTAKILHLKVSRFAES